MRRPRYRHPPFGLNMTPMIDVVFQLLIFFVCIVEFRRAEDVLDTTLPATEQAVGPSVKSSEELDLGRIDVHVSAQEVVVRFQGKSKAFNDPSKTSSLERIREQVHEWTKLAPGVPVRLTGSPAAPTGILLRVYDACLQAGAVKVQLASLGQSQ